MCARSISWSAIGRRWCSRRPSDCAPRVSGRVRMRLSEGLAGLVGEQLRPQVVEDATRHPRFKYFSEAGEDPYHSFLGVPLIDRGLLQGVLVVQTIEPRAFTADAVRMLNMAGAQLASIVSQARTFGQFVTPAHNRLELLARNLWWSWDHDTTSLFRALDPALWRELDHNPIALLRADSAGTSRRTRVRARAAQPHQLRIPAHAGAPDVDPHLGSGACRRALGPARRLFLGRVRPARVGADLFWRPRHTRRRSHQGGLRSRHPADWRRPLLRPGIFHAARRPERLPAGRLPRHRQLAPANRAGKRRGRPPGDGSHRDAQRVAGGTSVEALGRPQHSSAPRLRRRGQPARRPLADIAAVWRRRPRAHPPGAAAGRRRDACAGRDGHLSRRSPSERRPQRICSDRAGDRSA